MFKQGVKVDAALVAVAEDLSDELAQLTAPIEAAAWEIDSALSAIRKDVAGYRRKNKANPDGGECYTPGELEQAVKRAKQLLLALSDIRRLEVTWAQEDLANASRRTGIQGPLAFQPVGCAA
jgi:hypothetical protein